MKKFLKKKNTINILIILFVAVTALIPLFVRDYYRGHDTGYHVSNILSLTEEVKKNFFLPSSVVGNVANDFGYGTELFYPPLAHTTAAYINLVTNDVTITLKIVHFLVLFASGVTMYFLSKRISKDATIGLLSAVIYMLFPYHLSDIYIRDALAECFLFIFIPLIISGLYELFKGDIKKFYPLFIIGYAGGMLSHLTMMIYFTVLALIFLIIKFKETIKHLKPFFISALFILLIVSPFIGTLLEHKLLGDYAVFINGIMSQSIQWGGLNLYDYFKFFTDFRLDEIKYYIDIIVFILLIGTAINFKKIKNKTYNYIIIFGLICMFLSTNIFPWDLLPQSFRMIQFPWRFESYVAISVSLFAPLCLKYLKGNKKTIITFVSIFLMVGIATVSFSTKYDISLDDSDCINSNFTDYNAGMGWQKEYLPSNTFYNMDYYNNRSKDIIIKLGSGEVNIISNDTPSLSFEVTGDIVVELPRLFYYGYNLTDGNKKVEIYENNYGFIQTKLSSGKYYLEYTKTDIDKIFTILSITSIIALGIFIRRVYEKN